MAMLPTASQGRSFDGIEDANFDEMNGNANILRVHTLLGWCEVSRKTFVRSIDFMIQQEMMKVDMLWVCWNLQLSSFWNGGNPHKLLEYLSTGKPIASHYVSSYKEYDLLYMLRTNSNLSPNVFFLAL